VQRDRGVGHAAPSRAAQPNTELYSCTAGALLSYSCSTAGAADLDQQAQLPLRVGQLSEAAIPTAGRDGHATRDTDAQPAQDPIVKLLVLVVY
jgi:hypothetical protein